MITKKDFGTTQSGESVALYTLENSKGVSVDLITYGATINAIKVPDRNGEFADVVKGFDTIEGHEKYSNYQGMTVGRYANRIADGKFSIDGTEYALEKNEKGITCLHGGGELSHAVWKAIITDDTSIEMSYSSPDGAMGFPGKVDFTVKFTLYEDNALKIDYSAVSDKKTVINMTNHAYFNLAGKGDILSHVLMINADAFTPTDSRSIPTGELRKVEGTPFDFRTAKPIGRDIGADDEQLKQCRGYDYNFCLNEGDGPAAVAYDPESGRMMEVFTDLPGVQLYCGNFLDGTRPGKGGEPLIQYCGFCLETQFYPNTPNMPDFPQCTFDAGEKFESSTVFRFGLYNA
ncbi:MAG: galactose mutarotase [Clostridia bacterium]|nr:galactose mutarotase [Clostridia bacterium]